MRQKRRGPKWPPFQLYANARLMRFMEVGRIAAPGPKRIPSSCEGGMELLGVCEVDGGEGAIDCN